MPLPVLERVERRRVRYWRRRAAAVILIGLLAVGGTLAWQLRSDDPPAKAAESTADGSRTSASVPTATVEVTPPGPTEGPALLVRQGPLASHAFTPPLGAGGVILVDGTTGTVLWGRNAHERLPIASTTKIMTAVLTLEHLRLDDEVVIRRGIRLIEPFREGLRPGERIPVRKLLYGLLLFSGNDDALALGQEVGGTNEGFVRLMNTKAGELGLEDTQYSNSSGVVDEGNWSSAWDLAALTRHALEKPHLPGDRGHPDEARHLAGPDVRKGVCQQEPPADDVRRRRRREDRLDDQGEPLPRRLGTAARHPLDRRGARLAKCVSRRPTRPRFRLQDPWMNGVSRG